MEAEVYRFEVGAFTCYVLRDGAFNYPVEVFCPNVPEQELSEILQAYGLPTEQIFAPYTCLLIDTGQQRVLVDTGAGGLAEHADAVFPGIDHSTSATGNVGQCLHAAGLSPADIDIVIITHAHPDHVGGMLDEHGELIYDRADYFILEDEWEFWFSDSATAGVMELLVDAARHNLAPLEGRITRISDGTEIVPGIRAIAAPGHTPGHMALEIESDGDRLLDIVDVVVHPLHLRYPEWGPVFDVSPEEARETKRRIADHAADTEVLVLAAHLPPFPNLGHIVSEGDSWRWEPIEAFGQSSGIDAG